MALRTVTLLLFFMLSACGQKGPLYFAEEPAPANKPETATKPVTAETPETPEKTQQQTDPDEKEQ